MAINYQTLKLELQQDTRGYGYAAAGGNFQTLADQLNFPRNGTIAPVVGNVGPAISINRGAISRREFASCVVRAEMPTNAADRDWMLMQIGGDTVDCTTTSNTYQGMLSIFAANSTTRANLSAIITRTGSRAEELFGVNTTVTAANVDQALNGTP